METIGILDNLRSIYNVGAIFRAADGLGISKLYLCGTTPHPHPEEPWRKDHLALKKTALGAEESVSWEYSASTEELILKLQKKEILIIGLETDKQYQPLSAHTPTAQPKAFIVGNEVDGISDTILNKCDVLYRIPMQGAKESLNVAITFGITAYALTQNPAT